MKRCCHCGDYKEEFKFGSNKSTKDGYQKACKSCRKNYYQDNKFEILEAQKTRNLKNPKKIKEYKKIYYQKNRFGILEKQKDYQNSHKKEIKIRHIKYTYGIDEMQYKYLLEEANHTCEICGSNIKLCVDHNHKTNKVRGILCLRCNVAIGMVDENTTIMLKMVQYLNGE